MNNSASWSFFFSRYYLNIIDNSPVVAVSPAAFPPYHLQPTHVFPPPQSNTNVYDINELTSFIREQNKKSRDSELRENNSGIKLGIWAHSRPKPGSSHFVSDPVTVRALLPDVAVVFMKLRHYHMGNHITPLSVESVVALGPRERVSYIRLLIRTVLWIFNFLPTLTEGTTFTFRFFCVSKTHTAVITND